MNVVHRISVRVALGFALTMALVSAFPYMTGQAAAGECTWGVICGTVSNFSSARLRVAELKTVSGHNERCPVVDPMTMIWRGTNMMNCQQKDLSSWSTSGPHNGFKDVDAFTFPESDFFYNNVLFAAGTYVQIHDFQWVKCTKAPIFALCTG